MYWNSLLRYPPHYQFVPFLHSHASVLLSMPGIIWMSWTQSCTPCSLRSWCWHTSIWYQSKLQSTYTFLSKTWMVCTGLRQLCLQSPFACSWFLWMGLEFVCQRGNVHIAIWAWISSLHWGLLQCCIGSSFQGLSHLCAPHSGARVSLQGHLMSNWLILCLVVGYALYVNRLLILGPWVRILPSNNSEEYSLLNITSMFALVIHPMDMRFTFSLGT